MDEKQKLIDICFDIAMTVGNPKYNFQKKTNEELANWVRKQLKVCGFYTVPSGSSWGILRKRIVPDFGYTSPKRTKKQCSNPEFADIYLHKIAIMKKEFCNQGTPGWAVKGVCCGCLREFKERGFYASKN